MAVDANVLIYERIREELRAGKTPIAAIDAGFPRAFVTIADSQLTTLAAAVIMFWLGSGPIRGFAVTLTIGILHVDLRRPSPWRGCWSRCWLKSAKTQSAASSKCRSREASPMFMRPFPNFKGFDFFPHDLRLPFMRYKGICLGAVDRRHGAVARLLFFTRGLNYGVDFKGGSMIEVQSKSRPGRHRGAARRSSAGSASATCRSRASARRPTC